MQGENDKMDRSDSVLSCSDDSEEDEKPKKPDVQQESAKEVFNGIMGEIKGFNAEKDGGTKGAWKKARNFFGL